VSRYAHLIFYAAVLAIAWGFTRPGSAAGKAATSVTDSLAGVLNRGLAGI
jgi:hypothetical protein